MKTLVLGASGATGSKVVRELIERNVETRILVRDSSTLPQEVEESSLVEVFRGSVTEMSNSELEKILADCGTVISCLGHNISFSGLFMKPRNLVSSTLKRVCTILSKDKGRKSKVLLMNTTAYTNKKLGEKNGIAGSILLGVLHLLLPPHKDNMDAANYLMYELDKSVKNLEWVSVRPDSLIEEGEVTSYRVVDKLENDPVFAPGKTSRINVANFMAELITNSQLWNKWKYNTPVIYNRA